MGFTIDDLNAKGFELGNDGSFHKKKKNKFRAKKTIVSGIKFDSKKEGSRYTQLKMMQDHGVISNLKMQVKFPLVVRKFIVNGEEIDLGYQYMREYVADFTYTRDGKEIVEDVKSAHTKKLRPYKLKKKLMKKVYNIEIFES